MAPELFVDAERQPTSKAVDMWSTGILFIELITNQRLSTESNWQFLQKMAAGEYPTVPSGLKNASTRPPWLPAELVQLIEACLNVNPSDRPSFKEICQQLEKL